MLAILLAGLGLWLLIEGALYAFAPDAMKRFMAMLAELPIGDIRQSGLLSMALGGILFVIMLRYVH